jgi:biotin synthase
MLVRVAGTPSADAPEISNFEFVRTVAIARVLMPTSFVRLSAGREGMPDEAQALCFMAGANSIFCGDVLLTTPNPEIDEDAQLFAELGLKPLQLDLPQSDVREERQVQLTDAVL